MKKLAVLLITVLVNLSVFANNEDPVKNELRTSIVKLLSDNINFIVKEEFTTNIEFLINKKGELVVLNIDCKNPEVCSYIKSRLNYKKVKTQYSKNTKVYKMPLRIKVKN